MTAGFALLTGCAALLKPAPAPAFPGTTALTSPPGFETAYQTLRDIRKTTGRPLVHWTQVAKHSPEAANQLRERVNFDVPTTVPGAALTFFSHPTAQFIVAAFTLSVGWRLNLGAISLLDVIAFVVTASFWMVQEWLIHDKLLHSKEQWFGREIHRWHHELPYYHVSMDGLGLASVWFATVAAILIGVGLLTAAPLGPCLTALATYTLCGGIYEAAHYLAHTPVPLPKTLNRMRRHHTLHHTVSDENWLAFTIPAVDSLFGTNPEPFDVIRAKKAQRRREEPQQEKAQRSPEPTMMIASEQGFSPPLMPPPRTLSDEVPGLLKMARLNTVPMGAGLVALGAYGARATSLGTSALLAARLALGSVLTIIVTTGSMLINDYHDHKLGVDNEKTKPGRPLVTGQVRPESVKLVLKWAYALHLTLLCLVDTPGMRLWVLGNTLLTYLYSVHLKPITGLKNFVCATIVSLAVGLGALAMGGGGASVKAVWRPMAAVGGLIWHREIVMDIKDLDGDKLAGVRTLPVAFGAKRALLLSLFPLSLATIAAATGVGGPLAALPLLAQAVLAVRSLSCGFSPGTLKAAIELAPAWLLGVLVALTAAA